MNNIEYYYSSGNERIRSSELAAWLLSRGISAITTDEIATLLKIPRNQVSQRLVSPKKRREMVLLANGLWAPVPPEYMTWGAPPAIEFIDALMSHVHSKYYIGWLSAAALHGASHQASQVFQVATSQAIREKTIGRSRLRFYQREHIDHIETIKIETKSGTVSLSSRETTLLDIANDIKMVGGIDNAANLVIELCETSAPDTHTLAVLSEQYPLSAIRRLGYLLENFTDVPDLECLKLICAEQKTSVSLLDPQSPNTGVIDRSWHLKINREVNPDI